MEESKPSQVESLIYSQNVTTITKEESSITKILRSCCLIPRRYVFAMVALIGVCNAFTMRVSLNIAITQMVRHKKVGDTHFDPNACPVDVVIKNSTVFVNPHAMFDWDEKTQGLLLSSFYYGYGVTQILGGYLAQRYGGKWVLGCGLLSTALFTFLTPIVTKSGGATWLFILRIVEGMGEGPTMPGLTYMMARWIPSHERAFLSAVIFGGGQIGNIFGPAVAGLLMTNGGDWANVFYFFGGFGIFWFILWSFLCYSEPQTHPYITKEELEFLNKTVTRSENKKKGDPIPWKAILRSPPAWALLAANVGHDWGLYTIVTELPKYSYDVLKFNIATTGFLTGLPFVASVICASIFGLICDLGIKRKWFKIKTARKIFTTIASAGPAICIILASYSGCNKYAAMGYFILSMGLMGSYYSGMKVNCLDVAPNYTATLASLINTVSTSTGIITPYLMGLLTPDSTLLQWRTAFWICFIMLIGTNLLYCIWMEGEQLWWDDVRKHGYPPGWKHGPLTVEEVEYLKDSPKIMKLNKNYVKEIPC
ncbi:unnamed protein product, partial [Brenthis ino]